MDLMKLSSFGRETGIAGNGSSAFSNSSSSSSDNSKPSNNDLNNKQPKKPVSMRTRSSDRKHQRPHDQPPTDDNRSADAVRSPHRHAIVSATEGLLGGGATASKISLTFQSDPAAATPPPLKRLRQAATGVSSDDRHNPHLREAPVLVPAASTPAPAAVALPTQGSAAKYLTPSGGSCRGGRARKSKLSLSRRRPLRQPLPPHSSSSSSNSTGVVVGTDGSNLGSSWRPSPQQRHQSPSLSSAAAPPHSEDRLAAGREDSVNSLAGGNLASTPPCSLPQPPLPPPLLLPPPPPPPFVGLENLGETCYVNAVVQALVACGEAVMPDGVTSSNNSGGREDSTRCRERVDGSDPPSSVPYVGGEGISVEAVAAATAAAGGSTIGGIAAGDENNSVLEALGNLLKEMKGRNGTLSALASRGAPRQLVAPESLVTAPLLPEDVASQSENLKTTGIAVGGETAAMSETRRLCEPSSRALDLPRNVGICETAISPVGLVNLICEGRLNAGRNNTGGVKAGRGRHRGRLADPTASMGFGSGQQCASELLGKLLDLPVAVAAGVPSGCGGEAATCSSRGQDVTGSTTSDLIDAFRGELCAHTTCVECERDRATREEFTELTLPPLLSPEPPPSPTRAAETAPAAAAAAAANGRSHLKRPTLEGLVDTVLGSEILDGNSKMWCEACRLWTEAKRRFSIHSPPRLLALHVRPATGRQSVCPLPPAVGEAVGMRGRGPCKAGERTVRGSKNGEGLIERVLIVKGAATRRVSHDTMGPGAAESCRNRLSTTACTSGEAKKEARGQDNRSLEKPDDSEDVRYELVGIILHKGQTLGSGHYTFALLTGASSNRSVGQGPRQRPRHSSSALGVGAGDEGCGPPPRKMDARSAESASASATGGVHGSVGEGGGGKGVCVSVHGSAGEGAAGKGVSVSTNKEAFVLFDDACVRWLSPEEENEVLRGGAGGGGGLGDAFLVFYARRP